MDRNAQLAASIEMLYEAVLDPPRWTGFLERMKDGFGAGLAAFAHYDMVRQRHAVNAIVGPFDVRRYEEHFSSRNAWVNAGHEKVMAGVVIGEQLLAQSEFEKSEYYNDFLRRLDIAHVMAAGIRGDRRRFTAVSVLRSKRRGTFDGEEVVALGHVLPHLKRAVEIHERVVAVERGGHPLAAVADALSDGLILLDARGRPLFVNRAAVAILSRTDALQLTQQGLSARPPAHETRLRALVRGASRRPELGRPASGGTVALPRGGGATPLLVLVTRAGSSGSWLEGGGQAVAVWLRDPDAAPTAPAQWLRAAYGVSAAEAALATQLLEGLDLKDAAARRGISIHTARCQLKAVLEKTGTRGQTELVRLGRAAALPQA